ncbi:MAG: ComEC/Rec2 family competence protein, partial [Acidobacteriota bacterium]|nr:ComEC/Rec2 family competence protein [Acidobacteriota bacterium]
GTRIRRWWNDRLRASPHEGPGRSLAAALAVGERSPLPWAWTQALRRAGLSHLLAISGLHVGIVAWLGLTVASSLAGAFNPAVSIPPRAYPQPRWRRIGTPGLLLD